MIKQHLQDTDDSTPMCHNPRVHPCDVVTLAEFQALPQSQRCGHCQTKYDAFMEWKRRTSKNPVRDHDILYPTTPEE